MSEATKKKTNKERANDSTPSWDRASWDKLMSGAACIAALTIVIIVVVVIVNAGGLGSNTENANACPPTGTAIVSSLPFRVAIERASTSSVATSFANACPSLKNEIAITGVYYSLRLEGEKHNYLASLSRPANYRGNAKIAAWSVYTTSASETSCNPETVRSPTCFHEGASDGSEIALPELDPSLQYYILVSLLDGSNWVDDDLIFPLHLTVMEEPKEEEDDDDDDDDDEETECPEEATKVEWFPQTFMERLGSSKVGKLALTCPGVKRWLGLSFYDTNAKGDYYVIEGDGKTYTASTKDSEFDTVIGVYLCDPDDGAQCIAEKDRYSSKVSFKTKSGFQYYVLVATYSATSTSKKYKLTITRA